MGLWALAAVRERKDKFNQLPCHLCQTRRGRRPNNGFGVFSSVWSCKIETSGMWTGQCYRGPRVLFWTRLCRSSSSCFVLFYSVTLFWQTLCQAAPFCTTSPGGRPLAPASPFHAAACSIHEGEEGVALKNRLWEEHVILIQCLLSSCII